MTYALLYSVIVNLLAGAMFTLIGTNLQSRLVGIGLLASAGIIIIHIAKLPL